MEEAASIDEVVDLNAVVTYLVRDITLRMIFRRAFKDGCSYNDIFHEGLSLDGAFNLADYVPLFKAFDLQGITRRSKAIHETIDKVLKKIIEEHQRNATSGSAKDWIDLLLPLVNQAENSDGKEFPVSLDRINLKAMILEFIAAATDSSSITVEWAFSELIRNPHAMARLQEELNLVVGMDRMVEEADLRKLDYLEKVVEETLRLSLLKQNQQIYRQKKKCLLSLQ